MKETEDCFLKVKNDYLRFLNKEKIFKQTREVKINILDSVDLSKIFSFLKKLK